MTSDHHFILQILDFEVDSHPANATTHNSGIVPHSNLQFGCGVHLPVVNSLVQWRLRL